MREGSKQLSCIDKGLHQHTHTRLGRRVPEEQRAIVYLYGGRADTINPFKWPIVDLRAQQRHRTAIASLLLSDRPPNNGMPARERESKREKHCTRQQRDRATEKRSNRQSASYLSAPLMRLTIKSAARCSCKKFGGEGAKFQLIAPIRVRVTWILPTLFSADGIIIMMIITRGVI